MEKDFGFFCSQWELSYKRLSTAKCTSRVSNKWDFSLVIFTSIMSIFFSHTTCIFLSNSFDVSHMHCSTHVVQCAINVF